MNIGKIILVVLVLLIIASILIPYAIQQNEYESTFEKYKAEDISSIEVLNDSRKTIVKITDASDFNMILHEVRNGEAYLPDHPEYNLDLIVKITMTDDQFFESTIHTMPTSDYLYIYHIKKEGNSTRYFKRVKSKKLYNYLATKNIF